MEIIAYIFLIACLFYAIWLIFKPMNPYKKLNHLEDAIFDFAREYAYSRLEPEERPVFDTELLRLVNEGGLNLADAVERSINFAKGDNE